VKQKKLNPQMFKSQISINPLVVKLTESTNEDSQLKGKKGIESTPSLFGLTIVVVKKALYNI
jgi:hypothetical protein